METTERDNRIAWRLRSNLDHFEGLSGDHFDLVMEKTDEGEACYCLDRTRLFILPNPVTFYAISDAVPYTDYPYNDYEWPIMSRRMLGALLSVQDFPHRVYPIQVKQGSFIMNNVDFVGVQLLHHQNYFDWDRSIYKLREGSDIVYSVRQFEIHVPTQGLPPIFRLSASPTNLFISNEARQALKEAGIRGTAYLPLEGYEDEVDLPVIIPTRSQI